VDQLKVGTKSSKTGRKNDFLMEEDDVGETTASSTSDSEVIVVVNDVRRSKIDEKKVVKSRRKVDKNVNEEERVRNAS
jgi:hypothetical protein